MVRKAERAGIEVRHRSSIADFWRVLEMTFAKHVTRPTHTREEFEWLSQTLPESVYPDVAYLDDRPVAGVGYIATNPRVNASFYFCQDPEFQSLQGLSLLVYQGLERSTLEGYEWFDFGTSSMDMHGRENIFRFKESFAAVGLFRETFAWHRTTRERGEALTHDVREA
jgi:lipid II:glycine glycyltransferase (peptidoglycan interpeptide bridge formation enzyme)